MRKPTANGRRRKRDCRLGAAKAGEFAKMDSIGPFSSVPSGTYLLVQGEEKFAKMDSLMVEIILVSKR